jgi:Sulfotransferase family
VATRLGDEVTPSTEEYDALCRARLEHLVPVQEPLVLVSQIQRSGGTLLSQLFDGHLECHAHPKELKWGYPRKRNWPPIDVERPDEWFTMLYEKRVELDLWRGYAKVSRPDLDHDTFPFLFSLRLQKRIFDKCAARRPPRRPRDVLDCYLTSYFNAWLDNHNLYARPKRVVTAFVPGLAADVANVERFFADYPDGRFVSIVRDPRGWYASARSHKPDRYGDVERSIGLWRSTIEAAIEARRRFGERVLLVTYERLVREPAAVMTELAAWVGISMRPSLLSPTFNGRPIRADSSHPVGDYGILAGRADDYRERLEPATVERIETLAGDVYERAVREGS